MVQVAVFNAHPRRRIASAGIRRVVRGVVGGEGRRTASVTIVFIDGRRSALMNRRFLRHRGSTDVIAFPLGDTAVEGEVYVNLDRARLQARTYGVSEANEITRLVVHGTLHLLGYDDSAGALRRRMKAREDRYVVALAPQERRTRSA
ncbi:MAG: rRNA maturation RNase YbeY [Bacteroidota bacterium]